VSAQIAGPDFEGVLRDHGALGYDNCDGCECGADVRTHDAHRAHVAAALRAEVGRWLESEGARQVAALAIHRSCCGPNCDTPDDDDAYEARCTLAALAEQVGQVASVGEGEG
jgi:hypothetical protein